MLLPANFRMEPAKPEHAPPSRSRGPSEKNGWGSDIHITECWNGTSEEAVYCTIDWTASPRIAINAVQQGGAGRCSTPSAVATSVPCSDQRVSSSAQRLLPSWCVVTNWRRLLFNRVQPNRP